MTREFTDTLSRTWRIILDPWLVTKVKNETGILVTAWADNQFAMAIQLRRDPPMLCNVLWAICEEQAQSNGCAQAAANNKVELPREFARGLGQNTLMAALDALEGGIADFFMSPEEAQAMGIVLEKEKIARTLMGQQLISILQAINPADVAATTSTNGASSSQQSPASIPSREG